MTINKDKIKKILLITLSNIGDVVLTLPVYGALKKEFPQAKITVLVGTSAKDLFCCEPSVEEVIVNKKRASFAETLDMVLDLRKRKFDLIVDLKNTLYPLILGAKYHTSIFSLKREDSFPRREKHLARISSLGIRVDNISLPILYSDEDKDAVLQLLEKEGVNLGQPIIAVAAGAKSHIKRWPSENFTKFCKMITDKGLAQVVLIGDTSDIPITDSIMKAGIKGFFNLTGATNLRELIFLISLCKVLITNDSAPLHIGSMLNIPVVAIFGPTDERKYGPTSERSVVVKDDIKCRPCETALCRYDLECMKNILPEEVFALLEKIFGNYRFGRKFFPPRKNTKY
ncbi:MAG: glycosyltransferase family 9 protein [Candidatus Omnitrophota bacterium]